VEQRYKLWPVDRVISCMGEVDARDVRTELNKEVTSANKKFWEIENIIRDGEAEYLRSKREEIEMGRLKEKDDMDQNVLRWGELVSAMETETRAKELKINGDETYWVRERANRARVIQKKQSEKFAAWEKDYEEHEKIRQQLASELERVVSGARVGRLDQTVPKWSKLMVRNMLNIALHDAKAVQGYLMKEL
jgi:transketolase